MAAQVGQQRRVVLIDRLFEPGDAIRLDQLAKLERAVERKEIIGVDHQLDIVADRLAHRAHALGIDARVLGIDGDDHLEPFLALRDKLGCNLRKLVGGVLL